MRGLILLVGFGLGGLLGFVYVTDLNVVLWVAMAVAVVVLAIGWDKTFSGHGRWWHRVLWYRSNDNA